MYKIMGLKLAKREAWIDKNGVVIDDGINREIILCSSENERMVDFFLSNIKSRIHGKSWKIWKIGPLNV